MAEIQNNFIKSKMNKDLDDRLVPSGEYRDALNIQISRSEGENVGALENALGNYLIFDEENEYTCIGYFADNQSNVVYYFVTNYIDASPSGLDNFAPSSAHCSIRSYNVKTNLRTILVQGSFLNFSAKSQITGVNIIEDLLFWTDNRNQPRKINIKTASSFPAAPPQSGRSESVVIPQPYYTTEDQISVAKYYPWKPIILVDIYNTLAGNTPQNSTMTNPSQQYIPVDDPAGNSPNPDYDANWPGDPNYLEEKFIKLSYRFKFDDNEYSLMAPFTQACFIPKQNGYFLNGDNEKSYRSSIVDFFENNATQIIASIEFETRFPARDLKIKEVDILYKESDALQVKVIETISIEDVQEIINKNFARTGNGYIYNYKYISTKPYKSLPEEQIVRVYDKVPTRAVSQEIAGNRVIYGNFHTTQSPPKSLDYYVTYGSKTSFLGYSQIEYPNHTVKQNRNYQVGFILADRYGRQSSVILSSNDDGITNAGTFYGGSTVYVPYATAALNPINWPGYALKALVNSPIPLSTQSSIQGYPGLYKDESRSVDTTLIVSAGSGYNPAARQDYATTGGSGTGLTISGVINNSGELTSASIVNPGTGYTDGDLVQVVNPSPGIIVPATIRVTVLKPNPLGWYSYKIVVRQTEQDYYNVYLPGILNGYPQTYVDSEGNVDTSFEENETANVILFNDNINKVPRDLSEVGPDQKQYRSSVRLFGRVSPVDNNNYNYNKQYYPGSVGDSVVSISTLADTNYNGTTLGDITEEDVPTGGFAVSSYSLKYPEFYQSNTNPLVGRIETKKAIGKKNVNPVTTYQNQLAVYETKAVESLLDIYWETTSSGLISELNQLIIDGGFEGAVNHAGYNWAWDEGDPGGTNIFQAPVSVVNGFGNIMFSDITFQLVSVLNGAGVNKTSDFVLSNAGSGTPANPNGFQITTDADLIVYCGPNRDITNFTFTTRATYTNPLTLEETSTNIVITDEVANLSARFVQNNTVCPPSYIPVGQTLYYTPDSPVNGDALIATFHGVNGVNCLSEQQRDDITFNYFPNQFPSSIGYFVPGGTNASGTTNMYIRENVIPNYLNFDLFVRDARGAQTYVNIDLTIGASDQISINFGNLCDLGQGSSGTNANVWTLNNGETGGHSRLPITIGGLTGGRNYAYNLEIVALSGSNGQPSVQNIANCGFPGVYPSGNFTQPVSETTAIFYIELVYTGNSLFDQITFTLNVQDATSPPIAQQATETFATNGAQAYIESNNPCSVYAPGELCPPAP
jgi:hypothetical protein